MKKKKERNNLERRQLERIKRENEREAPRE